MTKVFAGLLIAALLGCFPSKGACDSVATMPISAKERAALFPVAADIEQGRALAEASCATCHGLDGVSEDKRRPNLAGQRTLYLYREMLAYRDGQRDNQMMRKSMAFLDTDAMLKTAIYYANLLPPFDAEAAAALQDTPQKLDDDPLLATRAATAGCASCHGANGNSTMPGMPSLTAQDPAFFAASMKAYQSGARTHNMMQMLVASLSEEMIEKMGLYYALQQPKRASAPADGDPVAGRTAAEACANCHGPDGNASSSDMPTLAGQDGRYLINAMKSYLDGQRDHGPMRAAMEAFDDNEINDMAAYYAAQQPRARQVREPLTAAEWLTRCDRCHGPAGNSTDPRYSRLSGQNRQYLVQVLQAYANGEREDSIMHAMSAPLDQGTIERIATFYATREPRSVVYFELPCTDDED